VGTRYRNRNWIGIKTDEDLLLPSDQQQIAKSNGKRFYSVDRSRGAIGRSVLARYLARDSLVGPESGPAPVLLVRCFVSFVHQIFVVFLCDYL
jgi:hypothetical protein